MDSTYTLSFYAPYNKPILVRRPWWNLFGHDKVGTVQSTMRYVFHGLTAQQAKIFIDGRPDAGSLYHLCLRLMSRDGMISRVQLEATPLHK